MLFKIIKIYLITARGTLKNLFFDLLFLRLFIGKFISMDLSASFLMSIKIL